MLKFLRKIFFVSLLVLSALLVFAAGNIVLTLLILLLGLAAKGGHTLNTANVETMQPTQKRKNITDPHNLYMGLNCYPLRKRIYGY
jgi:hypothetical protein